jgi:hypothetical protein
MIRNLAMAALLFAAACSQQDGNPPAANNVVEAPGAAPAADSVPSLDGQWRVAAIDGRPLSSDSVMTANFAGGQASLASGCVRRGLTYTQKRNVVSFAIDPGGSSNCEGRGTSAELEAAYAALQGASIAIFSKKDRQADLSGTGGNLTLERR